MALPGMESIVALGTCRQLLPGQDADTGLWILIAHLWARLLLAS